MTFHDFNFHPLVIDSLEAMMFEKPTPIQEQAMPIIIEKNDLIACAQTGTGKTAAYILPVLHNFLVNERKTENIRCVILAPTRELVLQIDQQLQGFAYFCNISSIAVYGGGDGSIWETQKNALMSGADIVVATPGRLIAHMQMKNVDMTGVDVLILDEADRMLDMGFYDDIVAIIKDMPAERQSLLFSATMPEKIRLLAKKILKEPSEINIALSKPAENILQAAYAVYDAQKIPLLESLLRDKTDTTTIIFASTKQKVNDVVRTLRRSNFDINGLHSDLVQSEREEIMNNFRNRKFNILVATNIVSRGIDIDNIGLIVNFDVPRDTEEYVHRIGRTARAEASGIALTLIGEKEQNSFLEIEQLIERTVHKIPVPAELGEAPEYNPRARKKRTYKYDKNKKHKGKRKDKQKH